MTDVLIEKKVAGLAAGSVVELTPRLQKHVDAGNATILPNAHDAWRTDDAPPHPAEVHRMSGTGHRDDDASPEPEDPELAFGGHDQDDDTDGDD